MKAILVSIYGILGSVFSPFYNIACASAITALGRKACITALRVIESGIIVKGVERIICANTDSVSFTVKDTEINSLVTNWPELNAAI